MDKKTQLKQFHIEGLDKDCFADDVNLMFPIDSEEHIQTSLAWLLGRDSDKLYTRSEQLYLLKRIIDNTEKYGTDFYNKIVEYAKGGHLDVDKIYTEQELKEKADQIAKEQLANEKKESSMQTMAQEIESLKEQIAELTKTIEEKDTELKKVNEEKASAESKLHEIEVEQKQKEIAEGRMKVLTDEGFAFETNREKVFKQLKTMTDEEFESFKGILSDVKAQKETEDKTQKTEEELKAEAKAKEEAKKDMVKGSEIIPNNVNDNESVLDKIMKTRGGVK